jgi:hypothetical protein
MSPKSQPEPTLNEEIERLEAEIARVVALPMRSDAECADLAARLRRLKEMAGMQ